MFLARLLRRTAFLIFWLMSAYLVLMLTIALSDQGQMTGELAASTQAPAVYPMWYAAPDVLDAAQIGMILYPIAAVAYLLASLIRFAARPPAENAAERMPVLGAEDQSEAPVANRAAPGRPAPNMVCTLDETFVILTIGTGAAELFDLSPAALTGRPILPLMLPRDADRLVEAVRLAHAHPDQPVTVEIGLRQRDEIVLRIEAACQPQAGAPGPRTVLRLRPLSDRGSVDDQLSAIWY